MCILLIYIGNLPSYTRYCIHQIRQWSDEEIIIITNDKVANIYTDSFDKIKVIFSDELMDVNIGLLETKKHRFSIVEKIFDRRHLFYYSCLRTFLMENFMKKYQMTNVFHMEIDNLIYFDPKTYRDIFTRKEIAFIVKQNGQASAGLFFATDWKSLSKFNNKILEYIGTSEFDSEMIYLWRYIKEYPDRCYSLPCITQPENTINCKYLDENVTDFNNELFDPAHIGQYLTGRDRCHTDGILRPGYTENVTINCSKYTYSWKLDEKNRRYPVVHIQGVDYKIMNLHVHSKDLEPHLSMPLNIPLEKTLFSGEQIQKMCDMFIGTQEDSMYNPMFVGDNRWLFISDIKDEIYNPPLIYMPGHRLIDMYTVINKLKNKFVLITHNSDENIDDRFLNLLSNDKIQMMFSQNLILTHEKAKILPIGIANSQWPHGNIDIFRKISNMPSVDGPIRFDYKCQDIYFFFTLSTNQPVRQRCKDILLNKGLIWRETQSFENYLADLRSCKFAICPVGNGVDTHRFWECILLGVIPVVENNILINKLKPFYKMVILDSWDDFDINDIKISLPWLSNKLYFQDQFPL